MPGAERQPAVPTGLTVFAASPAMVRHTPTPTRTARVRSALWAAAGWAAVAAGPVIGGVLPTAAGLSSANPAPAS